MLKLIFVLCGLGVFMLNGVLGMGEEGKREIPNHEKLDKVGWIS